MGRGRIAKWVLFLVVLFPAPVYAGRTITMGYQGVIETSGRLLDNTTGFFKFALCDTDCVNTFWSNDGTSVSGGEPSSAVELEINEGLFNIILGDTSYGNMQEIPRTVFEDAGDEPIYLRIWFDDGDHGSQQLSPDQEITLVPYAIKTEIAGGLVSLDNLALSGTLNMSVSDLSANDGYAVKITDDSSTTLFSVNEDGTAQSQDVVLTPLTSSSAINRSDVGRLYYDGVNNAFMGCNDETCAEIGLAGATGVADITKVTAGDGLSGGGTSGDVTLSVDTSVVVTKTGDHTMTGSLTASALSAGTVTATTMTTGTLTATGAVSASSITATGTATTAGVVMTPTGTGAGNTAELRFRELAANGSHYVGFKAPDSVVLSKIWVLPSADGSSGQVLTTNGSGTLSFEDDDNAGGDITGVSAGLGLSDGGSTGDVTVNVGTGTGIQVNADSIQFEYDNTLASEPVALTAGQVVFDAGDSGGGLLFEGSTADGVEGLLTVADPTGSDVTWTLPNFSGTVLLSTNCTGNVGGEFNPTEAQGTDDYLNLVDNSFSATETDEDMFMVPTAMTARSLRAEVSAAPGGSTDQWVITLRDDIADTTLTCTISGTNTNCSDTTNVPSIAAGSKLAVKVSSAGGASDPDAASAMSVSFCLGP